MFAACLLVACGPRDGEAPHRDSRDSVEASKPADRLARRRQAAEASFNRAAMFKPAPGGSARDGLAVAPIITLELSDEPGSSHGAALCEWVMTDGGLLRANRERPVVYTARAMAKLAGASYDQWIYQWWFPGESRRLRDADWGWLRVTLDRSGFPIVWETLTAQRSQVEVYVSRRLEEMAVAQHGAPQSPRGFAIEPLADTPMPIAVIRVLNDGPVAMGPFVYVDKTFQVSSVVCRCMASQTHEVVGNRQYELLPIERFPNPVPGEGTLFLPPEVLAERADVAELASPDFLEHVLRLPVGF